MTQRVKHLERGKRSLAKGELRGALRAFEQGLNSCSVAKKEELAGILYFLGVALYRVGDRHAALRSWSAGSKLRKRGRSRTMLRRFANEYGMLRQGCPEEDDWRAFRAIQLDRYLRTKRRARIANFAEYDMITDLIQEYWRDLKQKGLLARKNPQEKLDLFRRVEIIFPSIVLPHGTQECVIPVDFPQKRRLTATGRCACGSGLPYMMCCGRTRGEEELLSESF